MLEKLETHHEYWPERIYTTDLEKVFRNLPCNKRRIYSGEHSRIHDKEEPLPKPSEEEMKRAVGEHYDNGNGNKDQRKKQKKKRRQWLHKRYA